MPNPVLDTLSNKTLKTKKITVGNYGKGTMYIPRDTYKKSQEGKTTQAVRTIIPMDKIEEFVGKTLNERDTDLTYYVSFLTEAGWRSSGHITKGVRPNFSRHVNGNSFQLTKDESLQDVTVYMFQVVSY